MAPPRQNRSASVNTGGSGGTASATGSGNGGDTPPRGRASRPIHVPAFQSKDVRFWFVQLESMFRTSGIADDQTKYDYVVQALDLNAAANIKDLLESPPLRDMFDAIKDALIDRLDRSEDARITQLLSNEPMGDRRPSHHLRHLQALAGSNFSDAALASIWLNALPAEVQPIVAAASDLSLDKRADQADRIMAVAGGRRHVAAVSQSAASGVEDQIAALTNQISSLSKTVKSLAQREQDGAPKPKQARSKSPAPRPGKKAPADGLCWYHRRYQAEAQKCQPPCSWKAAASGNGQDRQ